MSPIPYLPISDRLTSPFPPNLDVTDVARTWLAAFAHAVRSRDVSKILDCIHSEGWWRDLFALTWDMRTFHGEDQIRAFLADRVVNVDDEIQFDVRGDKVVEAALHQFFPGLQFVRVQFSFQTKVGEGLGVAFLLPSSSGWKAFILATHLEALKNHPERAGLLRSFEPNHGKWEESRRREQAFEGVDPEVIIVGAGHSGLDLAARLKCLGVRTLLVDKSDRVGDTWRGRYEALCLHDPIWFDHMPYLPFPSTWPVYIPAKKLADWLEYYAKAMELNVWNASAVTSAKRNATTGKWSVTIKSTKTGEERVMTTDHVIFALGFGGGQIKMPQFPGRDTFKGQVLHSSQHHSAKDHLGKKVVVVGACTSAHDVAADYAEHGVDVTLFQRSSTYIMTTKEGMPRLMKPVYWEGGPPTDVVDRLNDSLPIKFRKLLGALAAQAIKQADKKLIDDLHAVGYKTNMGEDDSGLLWSGLKRGGGYYLDVGACQMIIDGKIKLKNDAQLERYTPTGLQFSNGSTVEADVVLFATGFGDPRETVRLIVGDAVADRIPKVWGINEEGEISGCWRELGTDGLWYMAGNFAWARFFSKHLALQIKAKQEGIFGTRYSAPYMY